jgi:hypothetical protein
MLKDKNPLIEEHVSTLLGVLEKMQRGQTLTFKDMVEATGLIKDVPPWPSVVRKLKRRFENERGVTLWAVPSIGYKLATTDEQIILHSTNRKMRALQQIAKGIDHLTSVPAEELTPFLQGLRNMKADAYSRNRRQIIATSRLEGELMRRKGPDLPPRR